MQITDNQVEKILSMNAGKIWEKYGKRRVYIQIETALNIDVQYYNTGNISSASMNGEGISNSKAQKILSGKCFIDLNDENNIVFSEWSSIELVELLEDYFTNL